MAKILMPELGAGTRNATVRRWTKQSGDSIAKGDILARLETETQLIDLEAIADGVMEHILVPAGKTADVGMPLAVINTQARAGAAPSPARAAAPAAATHAPSSAAALPADVIPLLMPQAGQSMEEGTIVKWRVKPGDRITQGQIIYDLETDKAVIEVEASHAGRVALIVLQENQVMPVKTPVALLSEKDISMDAWIAASGGQAAAVSAAPGADAAAETVSAGPGTPRQAPASTETGRIKASPAARKLAGERGIDLAAVSSGSGAGGRIISQDVLQAPAPASSAAPKPAAGKSPLPPGAVRKPMTKMRRAIASNLSLSKQTIPHFYLRATVLADAMMAFYKERKAQFPCSVNDVVVLACARAIREFPAFRSRIEGNDIIEFPDVNIGIAVGVEDGLTVPVLLRADLMSLKDLASNTKRIVENARGGKLEGMGQGILTITNMGMFGVEEFGAIINPPEAAIIAIGAARDAAVAEKGTLRAGKLMTLTLSCDHRIIDGVLAAKFMARMKELLEAPATIEKK